MVQQFADEMKGSGRGGGGRGQMGVSGGGMGNEQGVYQGQVVGVKEVPSPK